MVLTDSIFLADTVGVQPPINLGGGRGGGGIAMGSDVEVSIVFL